MVLNEKITVNPFYTKSAIKSELFGFLPVFDVDRHGYYSVKNDHPQAEFERITPVLGRICDYPYCSGEYIADHKLIPKEQFKKYNKTHGIKGTYTDYVNNYNAVKKNIAENPYLLVFVGCDDGDTGMRFPDRETALDYIQNQIVYFDEVYEDKRMLWIH